MARPKGSTKLPSYCRHKASGRGYATIGGVERYCPPIAVAGPDGPVWSLPSLERQLAHELGHCTGTGDTGDLRMDNIDKWENPIVTALGLWERLAPYWLVADASGTPPRPTSRPTK